MFISCIKYSVVYICMKWKAFFLFVLFFDTTRTELLNLKVFVDLWLAPATVQHVNAHEQGFVSPSLPTACSPLSSPYAAPLRSSHPTTGSLIKPDLSPNYTHKVYMHSLALQLLQICYKE